MFIYRTFIYVFGFNFISCIGILPMGPYTYTIKELRECVTKNNPRDSIVMDLNLTIKSNRVQELTAKGIFKKNIGPLGGSMKIMRKDNNRFTQIMSSQSNNLCAKLSSTIFSAIFPAALNQHCYVKKGEYKQIFPDMNSLIHLIIGKSAPYGMYRLYIKLKCGREEFFCSQADVEIAAIKDN